MRWVREMVYPITVTHHGLTYRCEKLAQSFYAIVPGRDSNPRPLDREFDALPQHHDATTTPTSNVTISNSIKLAYSQITIYYQLMVRIAADIEKLIRSL